MDDSGACKRKSDGGVCLGHDQLIEPTSVLPFPTLPSSPHVSRSAWSFCMSLLLVVLGCVCGGVVFGLVSATYIDIPKQYNGLLGFELYKNDFILYMIYEFGFHSSCFCD